MVMGVDEAGRGPVLGPLVVSAIEIDPALLRSTGIRDSKLMSRGDREDAFEFLKANAGFCILEIPASSIDMLRDELSMNEIEVNAFSTVIASLIAGEEVLIGGKEYEHRIELKPAEVDHSTAILDAADVDHKRFGRSVLSKLEGSVSTDIEIVSEHKADLNHTIVGAASVLAKVTRDRRIEDLALKYDTEIGSGYPSDPRTKEFLRTYFEEKGRLPSIARSSWETSKRILRTRGQSRLGDF